MMLAGAPVALADRRPPGSSTSAGTTSTRPPMPWSATGKRGAAGSPSMIDGADLMFLCDSLGSLSADFGLAKVQAGALGTVTPAGWILPAYGWRWLFYIAYGCRLHDILDVGADRWITDSVEHVRIDESVYVGRRGDQDHRIDLLERVGNRPVGRLGRAFHVRLREIDARLRRDGPNG
jgi:hypothetical protein